MDTSRTIVPLHMSKRSWNTDIKDKRKKDGREKRRGRNSEEATQGNTELQKSIQQSKNQIWSNYFQNLRGAEGWRAARYANPRAGMTVEALTDRQGNQANTSSEKEEMLKHESFPPNDGDQYYELSSAGNAHTRVTEQAVDRAIYSQSVKMAP